MKNKIFNYVNFLRLNNKIIYYDYIYKEISSYSRNFDTMFVCGSIYDIIYNGKIYKKCQCVPYRKLNNAVRLCFFIKLPIFGYWRCDASKVDVLKK